MTWSDLINVSQRVHVMTISVNTVISIGMNMTRSDLINVSQCVRAMASHGYSSQHCDKYRF